MDPRVAEAVLEFGADLRTALAASDAWAETHGLVYYLWKPTATEEAA